MNQLFPFLGTLVHEAVTSLVALGQTVELLQQLLQLVPLHARVHEAGPASQVQSAELIGQVSQGLIQGGGGAEGPEDGDALNCCGGTGEGDLSRMGFPPGPSCG